MKKPHLLSKILKLALALMALLVIVEVTTNWEAHKEAFWEGYEDAKAEVPDQTE